MTEVDPKLMVRLDRLERRQRLLVTALLGTVAVMFIGAGALSQRASASTKSQAASETTGILRVRELDVVDGHGVTRVKLATPLPQPIINGHQRTRGDGPAGTLSGMLLFDADGVERSGYATADRGYSNVLFTLDDKRQQHVLFVTEPTGATTLRLFNGDTKDRADISIDETDGPSITMIRGGKEVFRQPARAVSSVTGHEVHQARRLDDGGHLSPKRQLRLRLPRPAEVAPQLQRFARPLPG